MEELLRILEKNARMPIEDIAAMLDKTPEEIAAMMDEAAASAAFCKRSALRRVSVTKLSIMDFAASGSSPEKAVSAEKL